MALHTPPFVDGDTVQANRVTAAWLNDIQDKVYGDWVSVKDYGAVGDGVTDDTAAIQAALAAANKVYFPSGTYLTDTVRLKANQEIYGDGKSSILKQGTVMPEPYGTLYANSDSSSAQLDGIKVRDIQILGSVATLGFSEFWYHISFHGVINTVIDNCWFTGFRGDGVHIGSGIVAGDERHNTNVTITNCVIDGVNNDNRNGITVIDCDTLDISNNVIKNCTKSTMPGAIDIEPDAHIFHVVKNISITDNTISNITGNIGAISIVLSAATFTVPPEQFVITGNKVSIAGTAINIIPQDVERAVPLSVVISGNTYNGTGRPFDFSKASGGFMDGVVVSGNTFVHGYQALLAYTSGQTIKNAIISNNVFKSTGANGGFAINGNGSYIAITSNVFAGTCACIVGISGGVTSNISIQDNIVNGTCNITHNGTDTGSTNTFLNNTIGSTSTIGFKAWRTDFAGIVTNDNTAVTFNTATLPDSFPAGTFSCILNGDTGVPAGIGGNQGTLVTHKLTSTPGYEGFIYQTFAHPNNTLKLGSTFIRRRTNGVNTWTAWYEMIGV